MDSFNNLSTQMALPTQQLQSNQLAYGQHRRVVYQGWNPCMPMG